MYCVDNGRPAWDPIRMLAVAILQFVTRTPDREAAEAVQYDRRWRMALRLSAQDAAFAPSLLTVFRKRLLNSGEESLAFEGVLEFLVEHGWVAKRSRQRLDSTHVRGLLEHMSRLECVRKTLCGFLHVVDRSGLFPVSG
jgi:transposase